ncbi:MAG: hypothetical protein IPP16_19200 [Acidimicrobiaceae bacterium]|nr:hypothetical protein [Acidimicrobiaceae bacterium]
MSDHNQACVRGASEPLAGSALLLHPREALLPIPHVVLDESSGHTRQHIVRGGLDEVQQQIPEVLLARDREDQRACPRVDVRIDYIVRRTAFDIGMTCHPAGVPLRVAAPRGTEFRNRDHAERRRILVRLEQRAHDLDAGRQAAG